MHGECLLSLDHDIVRCNITDSYVNVTALDLRGSDSVDFSYSVDPLCQIYLLQRSPPQIINQATLTKLLTCCVLRPTQPPTLSWTENE